jgi:acylphosphatase
VRLELVIRGRVQGVSYRANAVAQGRALGLVGCVRNDADGSVHVLAEGPRRQLETLERWCHHGPDGARVDSVLPSWSAATGEHDAFSILR